MDGYGFTCNNLRRVERRVFELVNGIRLEDLNCVHVHFKTKKTKSTQCWLQTHNAAFVALLFVAGYLVCFYYCY